MQAKEILFPFSNPLRLHGARPDPVRLRTGSGEPSVRAPGPRRSNLSSREQLHHRSGDRSCSLRSARIPHLNTESGRIGQIILRRRPGDATKHLPQGINPHNKCRCHRIKVDFAKEDRLDTHDVLLFKPTLIGSCFYFRPRL